MLVPLARLMGDLFVRLEMVCQFLVVVVFYSNDLQVAQTGD